jgi:hypothetical protein
MAMDFLLLSDNYFASLNLVPTNEILDVAKNLFWRSWHNHHYSTRMGVLFDAVAISPGSIRRLAGTKNPWPAQRGSLLGQAHSGERISVPEGDGSYGLFFLGFRPGRPGAADASPEAISSYAPDPPEIPSS